MENPERVTYFAATDSRGKRVPFGIKAKDRAKHLYVIGKTGMGKSTLLENMAIQDIRNGEGLCFIDPHGETADRLLDYIPPERMKDVVYFAPFDLDRPIAFNVMEDVGYDKRHLVVSGLMATFNKIWVDAWSARMEYILTNTLLALLEYPDATLLGVNRMYTDKVYRKRVIDNVKDPIVKDFWTKEFANYGDRYTQEATPAIQNKIGQFTGNPLIRNIIGQPKSSFDIRTMMDEKKILIMNLSKGLVGETNMRLLGSMLTTRIFLAAMSRADLSAGDIARLPNCYFYVDEFQNFANDTFAGILSEARKYKLNLTIAHQYVEQMEEQVRAAVFGNVGTTIAFRVGPFDAEVLETVFFPEFTKEDLVNLGFAQIYLSLMIDGIGSRPFSAVTLPRIEPPVPSYRKEVIEHSRTAFGTTRSDVETAVNEELSSTANELAALPPDVKPKRTYPARPGEGNPRPRMEQRPSEQMPRPPVSSPAIPNNGRPFVPRPVNSESLRPLASSAPQPPRINQPRQAVAEGSRPITPPPSQNKSAEDLKSILRNMTAQTQKEKEGQKKNEQQSLKGALADVLAKSPPPPISPTPIPQAQPKPQIPSPQPSKPFEVPEDQLRSVLKGE